MNKDSLIKKATQTLADSTAGGVCVTSDGSVFFVENKPFADSHSQKLRDKTIVIVSVNDDFYKENKNLFFTGSKWEFVNVGDLSTTADDVDLFELSKTELTDLAKDIEGYKTAMTKDDLIELIIDNK